MGMVLGMDTYLSLSFFFFFRGTTRHACTHPRLGFCSLIRLYSWGACTASKGADIMYVCVCVLSDVV
jgi:hypothetical protein